MCPRPRKIPSVGDWRWPGDRGERYADDWHARDKFLLMPASEALEYFESNWLSARECLDYMPAIPFQYYIFVLADFILDPARLDDAAELAGIANSLLDLLIDKLTNEPGHLLSVMEGLWPVTEYAYKNSRGSEFEAEVFGSGPDKLAEIRRLYAEALKSSAAM